MADAHHPVPRPRSLPHRLHYRSTADCDWRPLVRLKWRLRDNSCQPPPPAGTRRRFHPMGETRLCSRTRRTSSRRSRCSRLAPAARRGPRRRLTLSSERAARSPTPLNPAGFEPRIPRVPNSGLIVPCVSFPPPLTTESPTTHYCTVQHHVPIDPYAERMPRADCSSNTIRDSISRVAPSLRGPRSAPALRHARRPCLSPPTHNREPYDTLLYCPTSCSYRSVCGTDAACRLQF